jgi:Nif-specific regulatory protein
VRAVLTIDSNHVRSRHRVEAVHPVVGRSEVWQRVLTAARRVAATDTTVLLQGESGTGKEVVARFIHQTSPRQTGPFVTINCAAVPEPLLESELFGYERGAFTGAQQPKPGQVEQASGGVLFLDEVSEMSISAQAKLLRFLQQREFQRLGGTCLQRANVRIIAATNRDLVDAVRKREFRKDLFYRLQVFDIVLPPLRERTADVPLLAKSFLEDFDCLIGRTHVLSAEALDVLMRHTWPGNVRELRNVLERAVILSDGVIEPCHLRLNVAEPAKAPDDLIALERQRIEAVLHQTDGNKSKAARRLGISRTQLYGRLRRYRLDNPADLSPS